MPPHKTWLRRKKEKVKRGKFPAEKLQLLLEHATESEIHLKAKPELNETERLLFQLAVEVREVVSVLSPVLRTKCACCDSIIEGTVKHSIHRDGFGEGPEVPLCENCGAHAIPSCDEIWAAIVRKSIAAGARLDNPFTFPQGRRKIAVADGKPEWEDFG